MTVELRFGMWQTHGMLEQPEIRYLLCRPGGGLNDILSEIGKCVAYGKAYNRLVIVQTNSQDQWTINDEFSNYFTSTNDQLMLSSKTVSHSFDNLTVFPNFLKGRVNSYKKADLRQEGHGNVIGFDLNKNYSEQLLVHNSAGHRKKRNALIAFSQLQLDQRILNKLDGRLHMLGKSYQAFHIRHTDYKTDFESQVLKLAPKIHGQVFLATDNRSVVSFFESAFGKDQILTFSKLPEQEGKPLHYFNELDDIQTKNDDAILDLLTLCLAKKYYLFPRAGSTRLLFAHYSGFSSLAARLRFSPQLLQQHLPSELHSRIWAPSLLDKIMNIRWLYF